VAVGVVRLALAFEFREQRAWNIVVAALEIIAGIVIVSSPDIGFATLAVLAGIAFILNGIGLLGSAGACTVSGNRPRPTDRRGSLGGGRMAEGPRIDGRMWRAFRSVNQIEKNTNAVVSSAKSDFPSQTQALSSSYSVLKGTVTQVSAGQTTKATLTTLAVQVNAFANAVDDFKTATNSKCS
jgi:hypothetical protein